MATANGKTSWWALAIIVVAAVIAGWLTTQIDPVWKAWLLAGIVVVVAVAAIWLVREFLHRRSSRA